MDYSLFGIIKEKFTDHLNQEGNERILYSGKFGVGKSTFLRHYFKDNTKYNCIHLYPVNYSILSNEDIFTYLKFDILFDLITDKGVVLQEAKSYDHFYALPEFAKNNWFRFLTLIPLLFDKLGGVVPGRGISEVMKGCEQLLKDYNEFVKPKDGDEDEFERFKADIFNREGGLYESNALTNIVRTELAEMKSNSGKENILIIDDLDRLDPDHIFRLLNVFSAHFDERNRFEGENSSNKYGFDKIILVCDNENIRNIFKARYGIDTDYNGYIDKFYSKEIFEHKVGDLVDIFTREVFKSLKTTNLEIKAGDTSYSTISYFKAIIDVLLQQNLMNLRTLFKYSTSGVDITHKNNILDAMNRVTRHNLDTIMILDMLSIVYGDSTNMRLILGKINEHQFDEPYKDDAGLKARVLGELIFLNGKITGRWERKGNYPNISESTFQFEDDGYQIIKTNYSDRSVTFSLDYQLAPSLEINYLALFKKYGLEKYK